MLPNPHKDIGQKISFFFLNYKINLNSEFFQVNKEEKKTHVNMEKIRPNIINDFVNGIDQFCLEQ